MADSSKPPFSILLLLVFTSFPSSTHLSSASDTISRGKFLSGDRTIVSKGGNFELGFFTPGNSRNYYIGIWYKRVSHQTVVWVANRDKPVSDSSSSELTISEDGNLIILAQSKIPIWSSKSTITTSNSTIAVLLNNGNLVLKHESNDQVLWQSFDHPTDTWLPGAKLGYDKFTGENRFLTSWKNPDDPSPGLYSIEIDPDGIAQFYLLRGRTQRYWASGIWNGHIFASLPYTGKNYHFNYKNISNVNVNFLMYTIPDPSVIAGVVLHYKGQMNEQIWEIDTQEWLLYCSSPVDPCHVPDLCGSFGSCNNYSSPSCQCLQGFQPLFQKEWDLGVTSGGCVRKASLHCGSVGGENDEFWQISNTQLPSNSNHLVVSSKEECASACLSNCSCTAYSYNAYSYNNGCLMWNGHLLNLKQLSDATYDGGESGVLYLRLAASEFWTSRDKKGRNRITRTMVVVAVAGFSAIVCIISILIWRCRWRKMFGNSVATNDFLVPYPYQVLKRATKDFSEKLGSGGFGSVFKGTLPDSTPIAVKKLQGIRQGEKQFRMEVSTIGMIHHVNLVRLRGFCCEGVKRLLVYDYAPNGSLDSHLFQNASKILDWSQRYQIALGIARGMEYLHEKCRECIIHCDIKPENILLDELMCPKLADFGMAKLIGHEYSRVLTTMRGTLGYLAPEWICGAAITPKADVYSFGMMLLELISGRRNTDILEEEALTYFPVWVATKLRAGDVLCSLDQRLGGRADMEELNRACKIACWCIQDQESCRPQMGQVVQMLEGALDVSTPPVPRLLWNLTFMEGLATGESKYIKSQSMYVSCTSHFSGDT